MVTELTYQEFKKWLGDAQAVEVDDQYVIYPPSEDCGEIEFYEDSNQEEPYFTITEDCHFHAHDGMITVYSPDKEEDHDIVRLGYKDSKNYLSDVYVDWGGEFCPKPDCESMKIESTDTLDHCDNKIYQSCRCIECGYEWMDEYSLTSMSELEQLD
jgi:hypothetical protein